MFIYVYMLRVTSVHEHVLVYIYNLQICLVAHSVETKPKYVTGKSSGTNWALGHVPPQGALCLPAMLYTLEPLPL